MAGICRNRIASGGECNYHIFLNSVEDIASIIRTAELTPENTRVICSQNEETLRKNLGKLPEGFGISKELVRDADFLFIPSMDIKKEDSVERDYTRLDQFLASLEFQNELFPFDDILLFKEGRYFSSYVDRWMVCDVPVPVRPYLIPITPELKRKAELIWSLKPQFCFGYGIFPQSLIWIKTENNQWLVMDWTTEQVSDAQTYLDTWDKNEFKKKIESEIAIPMYQRYLWTHCKIGPDGEVIKWTKRFYK